MRWYARRLGAMSPREVRARVLGSLRHRTDAAAFTLAPPLWRARWEPRDELLLGREPLEAPIGFLRAERAAEVRRLFPTEAESIVRRADDAAAGRARFFGYPEVTRRGASSADADPFSGRVWPNIHGKR